MEMDQLEKRVEWLDEERRNDKRMIQDLQKKIAKLEGVNDKAADQIKELSSEVTRLTVVVARVDEFDQALAAHRAEVKKEMDAQEERLKRRERDAKKSQSQDIDEINKTVAEIRKELEVVSKLQEDVSNRNESEMRLNRLIVELQEKVKDLGHNETDRLQAVRSLEDDRRQDNKRMTDLQGEVAALRKRIDEQRGKMELVTEGQRKAENRLNELMAAENQRREGQTEFIERINRNEDERERTFKEWNKRVDSIEGYADRLEENLSRISESEKVLKKAQETFDDITAQISRRINEITEMQRLGEERFRQEWSTFKADDQKRWTNYTLTQEEQHRETSRQLERLVEQSTNVEDTLQELQDIVQHLNEQSDKLLQNLLAALRDQLAENERFISSLG